MTVQYKEERVVSYYYPLESKKVIISLHLLPTNEGRFSLCSLYTNLKD